VNLTQLRPATLGWLDDPRGDRFVDHDSFARLDVLINTAYKDLVNAMDNCSEAWNVKDTPETLTVGSSAREYLLTSTDVRRPLLARRVESSGTYTNLIEAPWGRRDNYVRHPIPRLGAQPPDRVAWYRDSQTGKFGLVFYDDSPASQSVEVFYQQLVEDLEEASDIPYQVPLHWHHIIPIGAGYFGKVQSERSVAKLGPMWFDYKANMVADLDSISRGKSWRPI